MAAAHSLVVVGVTGRFENTGALRFAARHAAVTGAEVVLAHAVHLLHPPAPPSALGPRLSWAAGEAVVRDVREEFDALTNHTVPVSVLVPRGERAHVLAALSREAELLVFQHRGLGPWRRVLSHSTVGATAARSACPVVSIPAIGLETPGGGPVLAGLRDDGGPREVLEAAMTAARHLRAGTLLVHAWQPAPANGGVPLPDGARLQALHRALAGAARAGAEGRHADVEVELRSGPAAETLVELSHGADLVVVGRHGGHGLGPRLGSVAHAVIEQAACPVMVVPL